MLERSNRWHLLQGGFNVFDSPQAVGHLRLEEGMLILHMRSEPGLFSRSARISSHFLWRASSERLRGPAQASRISAKLSATVRRRAFHFLIASRRSWIGPSHNEAYYCKESRVKAIKPVADGCGSWRELIYRFFDSAQNDFELKSNCFGLCDGMLRPHVLHN